MKISISLHILYAFLIASFFFFKDIDECKEGTSGCSQLCNDNNGSFTCNCSGGYRLQSDKKSCAGEYFDEIKLCGVNLSNDLH